MAARKKSRSHEVDGYNALRAAQAAAGRQRSPPSDPPVSGESEPPAQEPRSEGKFRSTSLPTRHEVICYGCGHAFDMVGKTSQVVCAKCRTRIKVEDLTIEGAWEDEVVTAGTVVVAEGGEVVGGKLVCNNLTLEGTITGGEVRVTRRLTLAVDDPACMGSASYLDLEIGPGRKIDLPQVPTPLRDVVLGGHLEAHLELAGRLTIRATGCLSGSVQAAGLEIEEGGGLLGAVSVTPPDTG